MKFYDIGVGYQGVLDIDECKHGDWVEYDDVQRERARLIVKLLRERAMRRGDEYVRECEIRCWRTSVWCHKTADRIEAKYRGEG